MPKKVNRARRVALGKAALASKGRGRAKRLPNPKTKKKRDRKA